MNIVRVFPLSRGMPKETLSYFSKRAFSPGALIYAPIRNKRTPAIVLESVNAHKNKTAVKSADYELKKLNTQKGRHLFLPQLINAARDIARWSVATPGSVLHELVPAAILENIDDVSQPDPDTSNKSNLRSPPLEILQTYESDRLSEYNQIARSSLANQDSLLIITPTRRSAEQIADHLKKGVKEYVFTLHGGLTNKQTVKKWNAVVEEEHPVVIVATPGFISIPRTDLGTIIVESESSDAYKQSFRPFLDFRSATRIFAKHQKVRLIYSDTVLSINTLWEYRAGDAEAAYPPKFRYQNDLEKLLVDMKKHTISEGEEFLLFSTPLKDALEEAFNNGKKLFLYVTRTGMYPFTVCGDCGTTVKCTRCSSPLVVKEDDEKRHFVCNICNKTYDAQTTCEKCDSWKLWPLGVAAGRVAEVIREAYPDLPLFQIDGENTSTGKQARDEKSSFDESDAGVLVGTQMAIPYLENIDMSAIVSIDSLLTLPDIGINEKVFHTLTEIQNNTNESLFVQTRTKETQILEHALDGNVTAFYRDEIRERKSFNYPPFGILIKITVREKADTIGVKVKQLKNALNNYDVAVYPAFNPQQGDKKVRHALIQANRNDWPDTKLISILNSLEPSYEINVEPGSLL